MTTSCKGPIMAQTKRLSLIFGWWGGVSLKGVNLRGHYTWRSYAWSARKETTCTRRGGDYTKILVSLCSTSHTYIHVLYILKIRLQFSSTLIFMHILFLQKNYWNLVTEHSGDLAQVKAYHFNKEFNIIIVTMAHQVKTALTATQTPSHK